MPQVLQETAIQTALAHVRRQKKIEKIDIATAKKNVDGWIVEGKCPIDVEGRTWTEKFEVVIDSRGKVKSADYWLLVREFENDSGSWFMQTSEPSQVTETDEIETEELAQEILETEEENDQTTQTYETKEYGVQEEPAEVTLEPELIQSEKPQSLTDETTEDAVQEEPVKTALEPESDQAENPQPFRADLIQSFQADLAQSPQKDTVQVPQKDSRSIEDTLRKIQMLKSSREQLVLELQELQKAADNRADSLENEIVNITEELMRISLLLSQENNSTIEQQTSSNRETAATIATEQSAVGSPTKTKMIALTEEEYWKNLNQSHDEGNSDQDIQPILMEEVFEAREKTRLKKPEHSQ
jgi:hypothetical protein